MWRQPYASLRQRRLMAENNATRNAMNRVGVAILRMLRWNHDPQADADVEGQESHADVDYEEGDEEVLYAGPGGNFRGRG